MTAIIGYILDVFLQMQAERSVCYSVGVSAVSFTCCDIMRIPFIVRGA